MRVRWLNKAERSLRSAHQYVAADDAEAARRLTRRIRDAVERLSEFPQSGRHGIVSGTRELVVPGVPYIFVYGVAESEVIILRVFHQKQARLQ